VYECYIKKLIEFDKDSSAKGEFVDSSVKIQLSLIKRLVWFAILSDGVWTATVDCWPTCWTSLAVRHIGQSWTAAAVCCLFTYRAGSLLVGRLVIFWTSVFCVISFWTKLLFDYPTYAAIIRQRPSWSSVRVVNCFDFLFSCPCLSLHRFGCLPKFFRLSKFP